MRALSLSAASRHSLSAVPAAGHAPVAARPLVSALSASAAIGGPAEAARQAALLDIPRGTSAQRLPESGSVS